MNTFDQHGKSEVVYCLLIVWQMTNNFISSLIIVILMGELTCSKVL